MGFVNRLFGRKAAEIQLAQVQQSHSPLFAGGGWVQFYEGLIGSHEAIYKSQPAVRTVVDFLARNIGQLSIKTYSRVGDSDRKELRDHGLAQLMRRPNSFTTPYRLKRDLVSDLAIYDVAFWAKMRSPLGQLSIIRLPVTAVKMEGSNWLRPTKYIVEGSGGKIEFAPEDIVHFRGYNPSDTRTGISPLETLRRILAEDIAAGRHREIYFQNAARVEGYIERPVDAPEWTDDARKRFREDIEAMHSGESNAGKTGVLEEGMHFNPQSFSPKDSEYILGRKLAREEVAREYHIPLPMVGILDHATFSNIKEQHKNLYQDALGPWLVMIEEEIELQLLPEFEDSEDVYTEFNIMEKLKGSFEEEAAMLTAAVGGPWMTRREARARKNLPTDDASMAELVMPLNLGGPPAEAEEEAPVEKGRAYVTIGVKAVPAEEVAHRETAAEKHQKAMVKFFDRQEAVILSRKADAFDTKRWDKELTADLFALSVSTAKPAGVRAARKFKGEYDESRTLDYLSENSRIAAEGVNGVTKEAVKSAKDGDELKQVFEFARDVRAPEFAASRATSVTNFARREGAYQAGAGTKTWIVTSAKSRHPELSGETVGIEEPFSNGLMWPGDSSGGAAETAGCTCMLEFGSEKATTRAA